MTDTDRSNRSFATRLAWSFGGLFLIAFGGLVLIWYFGFPPLNWTGERQQRLFSAQRLLESSANQESEAMIRSIQERRGDVLIISENKILPPLLAQREKKIQPDVDRIFDRLQRAYPDQYIALLVVDPVSGTILGSSRAGEVGAPFPDLSLIARAATPGAQELIDQVTLSNGASMLAIARQMHEAPKSTHAPRKTVGIVVAFLNATSLLDRADPLSKIGTGLPNKSALIDASGKLLAHLPEAGSQDIAALTNEQISRGFEGTLLLPDGQGGQLITVIRHLPLSGDRGWNIVYYIDKDEALQGLVEQTRAILVIGIGIVLMALVMVIVLARRLTDPLKNLTRVAQRFGDGEFDTRASTDASMSREIVSMAGAFNDMAAHVEKGVRELESKVAERTQALAQERDTAQRYLDIARVMLMALDQSGKITMINRRGAELLAVPSERLLGTDWFSHFLPAATQEPVRSVFSTMMRGEISGADYYENQIVTAKGDLLFMAWNNVILRDAEGHPIGTLSSGEDITARKHAEEALRSINAELEVGVAARTQELQDSNRHLQQTLETLKVTQDELIQSEKMASLGALVAGVAHELNTPLGNSVTVCTTLKDDLESFAEHLNEGKLTKSRLNDFVERDLHGMQLLMRNLERANTLVGNFKRVATDQSSELRRRFDLAETVYEVVDTIYPQFKHTPHRMIVNIPNGIFLDSYPGPLGQVLTNLALNSLLHGFDATINGEVRIQAQRLDREQVRLSVSDNGKGISPDHMGRIFDPFFTTRLGQGGSGLGLHIVYNIIEKTLGGHISVHSNPGIETTFAVEIPVNAPVIGGPLASPDKD